MSMSSILEEFKGFSDVVLNSYLLFWRVMLSWSNLFCLKWLDESIWWNFSVDFYEVDRAKSQDKIVNKFKSGGI